MLTPLLFIAGVVGGSLAVVDLAPAGDGLAEALRATSGAREVVTAKRTRAVVDDAASFRVVCVIDDDECLKKLRLLMKVDELLALSRAGATPTVALVDERGVVAHAIVPDVDADVRARATAAWRSLREPPSAVVAEDAPVPQDAPTAIAPDPPSSDAPPDASAVAVDAEAPRGELAVQRSDDVALPASLVTAIVGGAAAIAAGTGALIVNAELARQLADADAGRGRIVPSEFKSLEGALVGLTCAAAVGAVAAGVGVGVFLLEPDDSL